MTIDGFVETLLAAETAAEAVDMVRRSFRDPAEVAQHVTINAFENIEDRPIAVAAALLLAEVLAKTGAPQEFPGEERLGPATNELLRRASLERGWVATLRLLREHREQLDPEAILPVVAWHAGLAQRGFPPRANGAALVITLGVLLGGAAQAYAHLSWARACEHISPQRALMHMRRAVDLARAAGDDLVTGAADAALRALEHRLGVATPAERRDAGTGPVEPLAVPLNESMAADLRDEGRLQESLVLLNRTLPVALGFGLAPSAMRMLNLRGLVYDDLSEYVRAEADFAESARLASELGDGQRRTEALVNAAASLLKRGQPLRAVPAFRAILNDADASGQVPAKIAARNNLATAYASGGDPGMARDLYRQALDLMGDEPTMGSYWIALPGLAGAYRDLGDEEAYRATGDRLWRHWTEEGNQQALMAYLVSGPCNLSDPAVAEVAEAVAPVLLQRGDLLRASAVVRRLAAEDHKKGQDDRALSRLDAFLDTFASERSAAKTCIFIELDAADIEAAMPGGVPAARQRLATAVARVEERLRSIKSAYDGDWILDTCRPLYGRLIDLLLADPDAESLREALWLAEASRPPTLTSSLPLDPSNVDETRRRVAGAAEVLRALASAPVRDKSCRTAVVSFVETSAGVGAFVVAPGAAREVSWVALDVTIAALADATRQLSVAFNGDSTSFPPRRPLAAANLGAVDLAQVDDVLTRLGGVLPALAGANVVCIVPSRSLQGLPLSAIRGASGRLLVQDAAVVVHPSLTSLVAATAQPPAPATSPSVFVAGVAAIEDEHPEYFEADRALFTRFDVSMEAVTGLSATRASVLAGVRRASVTHLSCHGFLDHRDPLGSGLLVSDGESRPSRRPQSIAVLDRAAFELTVRDLAAESLGADLVTLRACSTARSADVAAKEEISTLTRVLQVAGCRTVVSALWNVDQRSSLALFENFYRAYLRDGLSACDAMAVAQRAFLDGGGSHAHLYHWAAYMVSGDWRLRR
jgi:tetratricopeptide (TPR) repeat protein